MKKRVLLALACVLTLAVFAAAFMPKATARAAEKLISGEWEYEIVDKTATITLYRGSKSTVKIPSKLGGKTVTKIGREAFAKNLNIKTVTIPKTVTEIGWKAFAGCENLTKVKFAKKSKLTKLEDSVFNDCFSLSSIKLPSSLKEIGGSIFSYCKSLKSLTVPAGVTSLGTGLFYNCENLEKAVIKAKLKELPSDTFWGCTYLESVSLPSTIEVIGNASFGCCASLENFTVPANTKEIAYHAFFSCKNLEVLNLGSKVTDINAEIFYGECYNLEAVIIPKTATNISDRFLSGLSDDAKKYLVIVAPKGSTAANWAISQGITTREEL